MRTSQFVSLLSRKQKQFSVCEELKIKLLTIRQLEIDFQTTAIRCKKLVTLLSSLFFGIIQEVHIENENKTWVINFKSKWTLILWTRVLLTFDATFAVYIIKNIRIWKKTIFFWYKIKERYLKFVFKLNSIIIVTIIINELSCWSLD